MNWALILPFIFVAVVWFVSTGAIIWLDNKPVETFGASLVGATVVAGFATLGVIVSAGDASTSGAYLAFASATAIWGWHEMSFLMGFVRGPNRKEEGPNLAGWARFKSAAATLIHHEIALAATTAVLFLMCLGQPNQIAAETFGLLFVMRLSTKLNIFLGVANLTTDIMPAHMAYLKTYFRKAAINPLFPLSLAGSAWLSIILLGQALAAPQASGEMVGTMMLFALVALATLEHVFLMLPMRDSALWAWASPKQKSPAILKSHNQWGGDNGL
ncbi:putative photosynthetic complex assembly protein PuhE [Aquisediminimonas profunda]|uniref:putative photosynthetic complex assembly protein PuhE n=1 Tax=Aquisediminimonas profunda TaxID=1550733 RepID=UPI001FE4263B|nr:putative photosynthetic complex assembly protein PuhE [Aquisediminimonas profunda]